MTLFSRYIFREQVKVLICIFLLLTLLCFTFDFFERWDDLLENNASTMVGLRYLVYHLPQFVLYVLPVSVLLSTFITLGLLGRTNQLTAMKAAGISGYFISRPLFILAAALSVASFLWAEIVVPSSNRAASSIWEIEVKQTRQRTLFSRNEIWFRSPSPKGLTIYHIGFLKIPETKLPGPRLRRESVHSPILNDVSVVRLDKAFNLVERIDAREMSWDGNNWVFSHGMRWNTEPSEIKSVQTFVRKAIPLEEKPDDFQWIQKDADEMGFFDLLDYIRKAQHEGQPIKAHLTDLHFKVASSFFPLIVALFTIPLAMMMPPKAGSLAMGVAFSMAIGFIYYLFLAVGLALGHGESLPPFLAAWAANILFGSCGFWWMVHLKH